jgi:hypothetical protein
MKYEMHEACAAWPGMTPAELRDLADDIVKNGLRDPITLTPDGKLLDGRNRAEACEVAGIEITSSMIAVYDGDPVLFSISRNARRRHMSSGQVAIVVAKLATRPLGANQFGEGPANAGPSVADVAKAAGVPVSAIESAKAIRKCGTLEEIKAVETGRAPLRKTADEVRARRSAPRSSPRKTKPVSADLIDDVVRELIAKCSGPNAKWRTATQMSMTTMRAASAVKEALGRMGDAVKTHEGANGPEYLIDGPVEPQPAAAAQEYDELGGGERRCPASGTLTPRTSKSPISRISCAERTPRSQRSKGNSRRSRRSSRPPTLRLDTCPAP